MSIFRTIFATVLLTLGAASIVSAGPIDYYVNLNIGAGNVTGYIETDGTIGVLGPANILGLNLMLTDGASLTWDVPRIDFFPFTGSDLSATANQLLFNFGGTDGGLFDVSDASLDFNVCFTSALANCWGGNKGGESLFFSGPFGQETLFTAESGIQPIASMTLIPLQGGYASTPIILPASVGGIYGSIGGYTSQAYYEFYWGGGAFSATASVNGALNAGASYLFTEGAYAGSSCSSGGSNATLNQGDLYTGTISANLPAGQYCVGIDANNVNDPAFVLTFNTPVSGTAPEPSTLVLLGAGLGMAGVVRFAKRGKK